MIKILKYSNVTVHIRTLLVEIPVITTLVEFLIEEQFCYQVP